MVTGRSVSVYPGEKALLLSRLPTHELMLCNYSRGSASPALISEDAAVSGRNGRFREFPGPHWPREPYAVRGGR